MFVIIKNDCNFITSKQHQNNNLRLTRKTMNELELIKLKEKLPKGFRQRLASITGYSVRSIDGVLAGQFLNEEILRAAIAMAEEYQSELKKLSEKINSL